jgi:hypothetical protein
LCVNLCPWLHHTTSFDEAWEHIFPDTILNDPHKCVNQAFLTPLNIDILDFNNEILDCLLGAPCKLHLSCLQPSPIETSFLTSCPL